MNKETLRMQMLSGVITESEYKTKLQEDKSMDFSAKDQKDWSEKKSRMYDSWANSSNELKDLEDDLKKAKGRDDKEEIKRLNNRIAQKKIAIKTSKEEFKKLNESKESINEHYIAGGIVGIGAINQIPSREKSDYEMAFEHFLGERYETKFENREQDIEEGKEVEEPSLYEGDLNESNIDQMTAGIKDAFDAVRSLPLPDNAKLGMAKTGIGIATLNAIGQKISSGQNISPEGQARLQKAMATIKQATSIEEIEQALLDALDNYASTNKSESSLEEVSMGEDGSISQIQDEWLQVTTDIARLAAEYKKPKPDMQAALALGDQLKAKARLKQKLENEINNNIAGNDRDIRLIITQLT